LVLLAVTNRRGKFSNTILSIFHLKVKVGITTEATFLV